MVTAIDHGERCAIGGPHARMQTRQPAYYWHAGWRHSHRSSVCCPFSLQYSLQYFPYWPPFATVQLHAGCAHF
jgi:hypothetical protein